MKRRVISSLLAGGLLLSSFAGAAAFHDTPEGETEDGVEATIVGNASAAHSYFPWVPNGNDIEGMGEFTGAITLQNLEDADAGPDGDGVAEIDIFVGQGEDGGYELVETVELAAKESITLSADQLDIPEPGASVVAAAYLDRGEDEELNDDDEVVEEAEDAEYAQIAGVVKNVSPNGGVTTTDAEDTSVDGYSGLTGLDVSQDLINEEGAADEEDEEATDITSDGTYVLPIVQTNDGWNTQVRVANLSEEAGLTNVSVTLYGSGTQGYAGESEVVNLQLRAGDVQSFDLSDYVEEGWVGSAFITSDADVAAVAERYKVDDQMLLSNTSQPELLSDELDNTHFGALVFQEYNHWNTGISVANGDPEETNHVTITYYGPTGNNVGQDTLTIPPRGQEYIYTRGDQDLGLGDGFVGSVKIEGSSRLQATVDQVKYYGETPDTGNAMSYTAERMVEGEELFNADSLSMPLVQKGNPENDTGDTSGIQLYNSSQVNAHNAGIVFYGANGLPVAPTVEGNNAQPIEITLGANQGYTLYTHEQSELSNGFQGSVVVDKDAEAPLVGVSNNVNYAVDGDGSTAFPMIASLATDDEGDENGEGPDLSLTSQDEAVEVGTEETVEATLLDADGEPVEGTDVEFVVTDENGDDVGATETVPTDANGVASFSYTSDDAGVFTVTATAEGEDSEGETVELEESTDLEWVEDGENGGDNGDTDNDEDGGGEEEA